jgi:hypothetical protein
MLSETISQQVAHIIRTNENWRKNYGCIGERTIVMTFNYNSYLFYLKKLSDPDITVLFMNQIVDLWELEPGSLEIRGNDEIDKLRALMNILRSISVHDKNSILWTGILKTYDYVEDYLNHLSNSTMRRDLVAIANLWLGLRREFLAEVENKTIA